MFIECICKFRIILNINNNYFPTEVERLDFLLGGECLL